MKKEIDKLEEENRKIKLNKEEALKEFNEQSSNYTNLAKEAKKLQTDLQDK